jgi:hypothetical protein
MMASRDTTTGSNYEQIIELCLKRACEKNGMKATPQVTVGEKPGGGNHRVDWEIFQLANENVRGLISCKYQGTPGTTEEKIAYEVIKLLHAMENDPRYKKSWLIMGGDGWSPGIRLFVRNELHKWVPQMVGRVQILTTDQLINSDLALN